MKRGWTDHPKARLLASALGIKLAHAIGIWARLVDWAGESRPEGLIDGWRVTALPDIVDPPGSIKSDVLMAALVKAEIVDADGMIHDWPEHCEDSVHMKLARSGKVFGCGCAPGKKRIPDREWAEKIVPGGWAPFVCERHARKAPAQEQAVDHKPRARNPLADALSVCEGGPDGLTPQAWRKVGVALAAIKKASPDVTPAEVARRIANYRTHFRDAMCTATAMASHWGRCAAPAAGDGGAVVRRNVRRPVESLPEVVSVPSIVGGAGSAASAAARGA